MKIALGVSGGIAAYKAAEIVRLLQDRGVRVQVVMTRAAQEFVRPLTFAALSGEKVITDMFAADASEHPNIDSAVEHIAVAQSIDALLVAPATADVLAKFAQGIASDFLSTLYLATTAPVIVAPAMNVNMWDHPATQMNLETLKKRGVRIVAPGTGYLACGMTGPGRLAENEAIVAGVAGQRTDRADSAGRCRSHACGIRRRHAAGGFEAVAAGNHRDQDSGRLRLSPKVLGLAKDQAQRTNDA
jgi:phosphopantothenoylcysteine decarboxylase/phosphopantothenate--cysteine ligase